MGFGLNFGKSKSRSGQEIWGPQASGLQNLYTQAGGLFNSGSPYLSNALSSGEQAIPGITSYTSGAMPSWSNLMSGGSFGQNALDVSGANQMAQAQGMGFDTYRGLMNPSGNPYLDAMFGRGANNIAQQWANNVMPQISNNADMSGGYGGSRQGIAEGLSAQGLLDTIGDYGTNIYGNAYSGDMNRALAAARSYNTDIMGGTRQNIAMGGMVDQSMINALTQGQNAMNLGFAAPSLYNQLYGMQWSPYNYYSNIMGQPTALNTSKSDSSSYGISGIEF